MGPSSVEGVKQWKTNTMSLVGGLIQHKGKP